MCRHTHSILWSNLFSRWVLWLHCRVSAPSQFIGQSQRMYIDDLGIHSKDRNFMIAIKKIRYDSFLYIYNDLYVKVMLTFEFGK